MNTTTTAIGMMVGLVVGLGLGIFLSALTWWRIAIRLNKKNKVLTTQVQNLCAYSEQLEEALRQYRDIMDSYKAKLNPLADRIQAQRQLNEINHKWMLKTMREQHSAEIEKPPHPEFN